MSRIECKWAKSFVLPHLHSIRLMWSTASELGLRNHLNSSENFVMSTCMNKSKQLLNFCSNLFTWQNSFTAHFDHCDDPIQTTLNHVRFVFYHNIKGNERNLSQDLLTVENTDSDLKVHALHDANELLVRVRLSLQKLLQTRSTCRSNKKNIVWERSNYAYSLSIRI